MESKLMTKRMGFILSLLEEEKRAMTIEEISDIGFGLLSEKGLCNQYTYNQVSASVYALYRRGKVVVDNIPDNLNPTAYTKDTIVTML